MMLLVAPAASGAISLTKVVPDLWTTEQSPELAEIRIVGTSFLSGLLNEAFLNMKVTVSHSEINPNTQAPIITYFQQYNINDPRLLSNSVVFPNLQAPPEGYYTIRVEKTLFNILTLKTRKEVVTLPNAFLVVLDSTISSLSVIVPNPASEKGGQVITMQGIFSRFIDLLTITYNGSPVTILRTYSHDPDKSILEELYDGLTRVEFVINPVDLGGAQNGNVEITLSGPGNTSGKTSIDVIEAVERQFRIGVVEQESGIPISDATVRIERVDARLGFLCSFEGVNSSQQAVYVSPFADPQQYVVQVSAKGYETSGRELIAFTAPPGEVKHLVTLKPLSSPAPIGSMDVVIELLDESDNLTGTQVLVDTIVLKQDNEPVDADFFFADGVMTYVDLPVGPYTVSVPDGDNLVFTATSEVISEGATTLAILTAKQASASPSPAHSPAYTERGSYSTRGGETSGQIYGDAYTTSGGAQQPLRSGRIVETPSGSGASFYTNSTNSGLYYFPAVYSGNGFIQAFTEPGGLYGPGKNVVIVAGQLYGDDPSEDSTLYVPLDEGDNDNDGLMGDEELLLGTDPHDVDSDGDGLTDGNEVTNGSDPLDALDGPLNHVWVNQAFYGDSKGTKLYPDKQVGEGFSRVLEAGTLHLLPGNYAEQISMSKPLTLIAESGPVTIGLD